MLCKLAPLFVFPLSDVAAFFQWVSAAVLFNWRAAAFCDRYTVIAPEMELLHRKQSFYAGSGVYSGRGEPAPKNGIMAQKVGELCQKWE